MVAYEDLEVLPQQSLSTSNNSPLSWALANFWLRCCENDHKTCRSLAPEGRKLPTRLIDLGPDSHTVRPRICRSASLNPDTRYTTLSHRWGEETEKCRLTTEVEQPWSNALPLSKLPSVFKEAMEATKRLGMHYIWIDSLCILQDSAQDWQREAASMGDVYKHSTCNLSAAAGNTGLFTTRSLADVNLCVVQPSNFLGMGTKTPQYCCYDDRHWYKNITSNPLFNRGWVLQERVLAPRCLHFAGTQIFWECLELAACESLPAGIPNLRHAKPSTNTISLAGGNSPVGWREDDDSLKPYYLWERIVEEYSKTSLTFPAKDKLAALSGVAKGMGLSSEEYFAGIWKEHLVIHLLWSVQGTAERLWEYQAPSWSWASVSGEISTAFVWPNHYQEALLTSLLSASVTPTSEDPTGPVLAGYLLLRGPIARVPPGKEAPPNSSDSETESNENPGGIKDLWCYFDVSSDSYSNSSEPFYFLLLAYHSSQARGILLTRSGLAEGEFYRRGKFSTGQYGDWEKDNMRLLMKLFEGSREDNTLRKLKRGTNLVKDGYNLPMYEIRLI